jgi:hypothetical protein
MLIIKHLTRHICRHKPSHKPVTKTDLRPSTNSSNSLNTMFAKFSTSGVCVHNSARNSITTATPMTLRTFPWSPSLVKLGLCAATGRPFVGRRRQCTRGLRDHRLELESHRLLSLERDGPAARRRHQPPTAARAGARGNAYYYNDAAIDPTLNAQHAQPGALTGSSDTAVTFDGIARLTS